MRNNALTCASLRLHAVTAQLDAETVDSTALRLLEAIAVAAAQRNALTVTQAMQLSDIASPATIPRKLRALDDQQLIKFIYMGKDRRTKYLVATDKANNYFNEMGNAVAKALALTI
jgi:DNA-binding MarR family transcriptional regulator